MKSPVRENRTPGSVRGLSVNWQSYRDQLLGCDSNRTAITYLVVDLDEDRVSARR